MKKRPWLRGISAVVYSVVVALVLLEVVLRLFDPIGVRYYFDAYEYFGTATVEDSVFAYINTPGFNGRLQGVDVSINGQGLRSPEFPVAKPTGEKRLLLLGDSVVFGWGLPQDSIFPALIRERIRNDGWTVISAGVGSWNTRTEYEWLRTRGVDYAPDAVLLVIVPNDVEPKLAGRSLVDKEQLRAELEKDDPKSAFGRAKRKALRGITRVSYAAATLSHVFRRRSASPLLRMLDGESPAWRDARNALDGMVALCRDRGIELVVYLWGDGESDFSRAFMNAYGGRLDDLGVAHHTLPKRLFAPAYRNSIVDSHPNADGHRIIAQDLLATLSPILSR